MKKIFAILALAALLMVPVSAMAISQIADSDLAAVTGQSGVSINLDVAIDMSIDVIAWGDSDGIQNTQGYNNTQGDDTFTLAGFVGLSNLEISNLHMRMRNFSQYSYPNAETLATDAEWDEIATLVAANADGNNTDPFKQVKLVNYAFVTHNQYSKALTIDVASDNASDKTIVSIGVPTAVISLDSMTANVALFNAISTASNNPNKITSGANYLAPQLMGSLNVNGLTALLWGGRVDISATTATAGVNIEMKDVKIETVSANGISWGDPDGTQNLGGVGSYAAYDQAGYVGIGGSNLIQNMVLNGGITIDVASVNTATLNTLYNSLTSGARATWVSVLMGGTPEQSKTMLYGMKKVLGTPVRTDSVTYVHLGLRNFNINIEQLRIPIMLGYDTNLFFGTPEVLEHELGVVYGHNLDVTVLSGSWVDILAH